MKKLLFLLFLPLSLFAQTPDATIKTNTNNLIRNSTNVTRANHSLINDQITDSKESRIQPFIAVGTNTYTVTIPYVTSYLFGLTVPVQFLNANSGASTINITGSSGSPLGAKSLKKSVTTDLATGDILANESKVLWYDGTSFQVRNIAGSGGGGGISGLTSGRVTFATSGTTIGDDSNLIWDNTNKNLGVGTTPDTDARIHVNKTSSDAVVRVECGSNSGYSFFQAKNSIGQTVDFGKAGSASGSFGVITSSTAYMYSVDDIAFATPSGKIKFGTGVGVAEKMTLNSSGQLGIGTSSPATSALLDLTSSTLALKLTEATRASITTPVNGMLTVDTNVPYFHNATNWGKVIVADASNNIVLGGGATASQLRFLEPSGSGSNYASIEAPTLAANNNYILPNAYPTVSGQVLSSNTTGTMSWTPFALSGTASTTMTFPTTSATIARTDAAQTFTGVQSMTSPDITTTITTPSTSFDAFNTTATTGNLFGAATTLTIGATTGTLNLRNVTLTAANATSFAMNGASPSITTTSTGTASVFNTAALTGNLFGAATTLSVGGTPTGAVTHNYSANATATATTKTVNLGTAGAAGSTTNVNIGSATASAVLGTLTLGFPTIVQPSNYTSLALFNTQSTTVNFAGAATTFNLGGTPTTALTANIFTNATATATIKTINIGTGGASGSSTNVNIGSAVTGAVSGTLTLGMTTIAQSANFNSINLLNTQTTTIDAFGVATNLSIGNTATAAQTVNMFTASTGASTYNIATGATLTATTKTINIGTAGVSGSTTNVSIGSATGGGQINLNERVIFQSTETAGGTTGNQTINLPSGSVNFAAAATSITVTNSLATTTSHIFCTIETNDATATIKNVVRASGSFTINLNAAATAETRVGFLVIN